MSKIYKILGKKGRITIPIETRIRLGFSCNDIISFEEKNNTVILRKEKICNKCNDTSQKNNKNSINEQDLINFLDNLSSENRKRALLHLSFNNHEIERHFA